MAVQVHPDIAKDLAAAGLPPGAIDMIIAVLKARCAAGHKLACIAASLLELWASGQNPAPPTTP